MLDAGLDLFADQPVDAIAVDQIVARAGVAKGSFFNHFTDKATFAAAIADAVRNDLESRVATANREVTDPLARLVTGMRVAAEFALEERRRTMVMLRAANHQVGVHHPLNAGVTADVAAAVASGHARAEAAGWGVLYWLGLCQVQMADIARRAPRRAEVADALASMALLGLTGFGADEATARLIAHDAARRVCDKAARAQA